MIIIIPIGLIVNLICCCVRGCARGCENCAERRAERAARRQLGPDETYVRVTRTLPNGQRRVDLYKVRKEQVETQQLYGSTSQQTQQARQPEARDPKTRARPTKKDQSINKSGY